MSEPETSTGYTRTRIHGLEFAKTPGGVTNRSLLHWPKQLVGLDAPLLYWVMFDAKSNGNLLMSGSLEEGKQPAVGTIMMISPQELVLKVLGSDRE